MLSVTVKKLRQLWKKLDRTATNDDISRTKQRSTNPCTMFVRCTVCGSGLISEPVLLISIPYWHATSMLSSSGTDILSLCQTYSQRILAKLDVGSFVGQIRQAFWQIAIIITCNDDITMREQSLIGHGIEGIARPGSDINWQSTIHVVHGIVWRIGTLNQNTWIV